MLWNFQPTLLIPVKCSCVMAAYAACRAMVVCHGGGREKQKDVPMRPCSIFYLWPTGSPSACPLDDTQEVSITAQPSHHNTSQPDQSLTVKLGVVSRELLLVSELVWCPSGRKGVSFHACAFFVFLSRFCLVPPVTQSLQGSSRVLQTRSECQGARLHLCARPLAIQSLSCTGTRRARRSTPSVSRWLSQCTMFSSNSMTNQAYIH